MAIDWIKLVEKDYLKSTLPDVRPGDTVKVKIKIVEGNKERSQAYEGVVLKLRGSGINKTVTVRRVFQGIGVERVFLLHSPKVESIEILRKGDVRRAKLYYLRELTGKAARIKERVGLAAEQSKKAVVTIETYQVPGATTVAPVKEEAAPEAVTTEEANVEQTAPEAVVAQAETEAPEATTEEAAPEQADAPAEESSETTES